MSRGYCVNVPDTPILRVEPELYEVELESGETISMVMRHLDDDIAFREYAKKMRRELDVVKIANGCQ